MNPISRGMKIVDELNGGIKDGTIRNRRCFSLV
jgi:hypothetical protein